MFTKCDINNTYKSSGIHVHTSGTVSPIQAAIRMSQISPLKMNNKFQGFHPTCTQFGQAYITTVIANEQCTNHLSVN